MIDANDVQGLVFWGWGDKPNARFLLLQVKEPSKAKSRRISRLPRLGPGAGVAKVTRTTASPTTVGIEGSTVPMTRVAVAAGATAAET